MSRLPWLGRDALVRRRPAARGLALRALRRLRMRARPRLPLLEQEVQLVAVPRLVSDDVVEVDRESVLARVLRLLAALHVARDRAELRMQGLLHHLLGTVRGVHRYGTHGGCAAERGDRVGESRGVPQLVGDLALEHWLERE